MKQIDNNAELTSNNLVGCDVAYPTRQKIKHTRNTVPGAIPNASGLCSREFGCTEYGKKLELRRGFRETNDKNKAGSVNNVHRVFSKGRPAFS
jgi:hypothetical protein